MKDEDDETAGSAGETSRIPSSKVRRAASILGTSAKVGGNYLKYIAKKTIDPATSKEELHEKNASDIFESLGKLKGSALKVAQMMSMDNSLLPKAYQDKFALAQYNAPPLSYPLVLKTFQQYFGQKPTDLYDEFSRSAIHAASIGQVHRAKKEGKDLAVKIQYPGVAESISSDLRMIRPLASQMLNMKASELNHYLEEVESRLLEETDYVRELKNGTEIGQACAFIQGLRFPHYYSEWSNHRILTMDWIEGKMFPEYLKTNPSQEERNRIGQSMWDFFLYQIRDLRKVHADPHPGNFIIDKDKKLCVVDFGCIKIIPEEFADNYFQLLSSDILDDPDRLENIYLQLGLFKAEDSEQERAILRDIYAESIGLLAKPFHTATFNFADDEYFERLFGLGESLSQNKELRKMNNARGSKHAIYIMRTFFGLYSLLHQLRAEVRLNYPLVENSDSTKNRDKKH